MNATTIEELACDVLCGIDGRTTLDVVRGETSQVANGIQMVIRIIRWDIDEATEVQSIRDVVEQTLIAVPAGADEARLRAYFEGIVLGLRRLDADAAEMIYPVDLFPTRAFEDPACTTAEQFAARIPVPEETLSADGLDDLTGTAPIAENLELERAIAEDPTKLDAHLVYADWLTERGDPRGELIACWAPDAPPDAKYRGGQVFAAHKRYFVANLMASDILAEVVRLDWETGWIKAAAFDLSNDLAQRTENADTFVATAVRGVFALPSSKFLQALTLGHFAHEGSSEFDRLYREMRPRRSLRTLFIGATEREQTEVSWTSAGDIARVAELFPDLHDLKLRIGSMNFDGARFPQLRRLVIESGGTSKESVRAIAAHASPHLEYLELWLGSSQYNGDSTVDDLASLFGGEKVPALRSLGLRNCEYTDAIAGALAMSPLLPRIRELDLSKGLLSAEGVATIVRHRDRFAHLAKLDVSESYLDDDSLAALRAIVPNLVAEDMRDPDDDPDDRYVSLGE